MKSTTRQHNKKRKKYRYIHTFLSLHFLTLRIIYNVIPQIQKKKNNRNSLSRFTFTHCIVQSWLQVFHIVIFVFLLNTLSPHTHTHIYSYQILNPKDISGMEDPKKCSKILIESTALDPDLYRLGHTKARVSLKKKKFLQTQISNRI